MRRRPAGERPRRGRACLVLAIAGAMLGERPAWAAETDLDLDLVARVYSYAHDSEADSVRVGGTLRAEPRIGVAWPSLRMQLAAVVRADNLGYVRTEKLLDAAGDDDVRRSIDYGESFVEWDRGSWSLRAGKLLFAWGTADSVNPVDILNPRDYTDIVEFEKVPVDAVALTHFGEWVTVTGAVLPGFQPSRLPSPRTRFFPPPPPRVSVGPVELPVELALVSARRTRPDTSSTRVPVALKLDGSLRGVDWFGSYYQGATRDGLIDASTRLSPDARRVISEVRRVFPRQRVFGAGLATFFGPFGVRAEAAYFKDLERQGDDYVQLVFGGDRRWSDLIGDVDLGVNLQYALDRTRDRGRIVNQTPAVMSRVFSDNVLLRVDLEFNPDTSALLEATMNVDDSDGFGKFEIVTRIRGAWQVAVGCDLFFGSSDGFFSQFQRNDRFFVRVESAF